MEQHIQGNGETIFNMEKVLHNFGVECWPDGAKYDGEYLFGKKCGFGVYIWTDKSKYTGNWKNNTLDGKVLNNKGFL